MSVLVLLALLPGIAILVYVYHQDRVEQEPMRLVLRLLLFGAFACLPAAMVESLLSRAISSITDSSTYLSVFLTSFFCAALTEETLKFFVLKRISWRNSAFSYRYDAIVYAVSVSLGFAMLENVLYVLSYGLQTAVVRALLAVPLHAFCGVFMGIHFGAAKQAEIAGNLAQKRRQLWLAVLIPLLIHGYYDYWAMLQTDIGQIVLFAFVIVLYVLALRRIRCYSANDATTYFYAEGRAAGEMTAEPVCIRHANGWCLAGLCCGVFSLVGMTMLVVPNVLAVVLSLIGLRRCAKTGAPKAAGVVGVLLGLASCVLAVIVYTTM